MSRPSSPPLSDDPSPRREQTLLSDLDVLVAAGLVEERDEPQGVVFALTPLGRHTPEFGT
jgi:DNA-binding PadR family transcriptional regulator